MAIHPKGQIVRIHPYASTRGVNGYATLKLESTSSRSLTEVEQRWARSDLG
ncbi:hypothetical protein X777_15023 [Ooceraea biroi]|uniref:Uncharacterized protein n=1 Tax=Ooceraea biroi TaxID=2015173 RepID=A0A026WUR8_OOCBI|nr:hypothetical protein X777_15023 [Ooceraea biroi]